ncbi:hypothetical protein BCV69DRAFT_301928 [Microstroma glucosiphilum]|uniref:Uncharacterized protein n=1 Tax=Pseudomicrostroma glucosiphilum TaxID=1684307 RepID=A0A316TVY1_9BASI|nr:hypothetical protein BCV69DRAFT_301928 [Pseudomicrostroma glucosiphilum]PWN17692.1 hypothetical protein BCV69DRAFT_301928 [Pseudomicrostroma glucosiphilum]
MKRHFSLFFGKKTEASSKDPRMDKADDSVLADPIIRQSLHRSPPRLPASDRSSPFKVGFESSRSQSSLPDANNGKAPSMGGIIVDTSAGQGRDSLKPGTRQIARSASAGPSNHKQHRASEEYQTRAPRQEVQAFNEEILKKFAARTSHWQSPLKVRAEDRARARQDSLARLPPPRGLGATVRSGHGPTAAGPGKGIHASGRQFSAMSLADRLGLAKEHENDDEAA